MIAHPKKSGHGIARDENQGADVDPQQQGDEEKELANQLAKYPELIANSAAQREPHHLTHYLRELAGQFHTYYNAHKVLIEDTALRDARVSLYLAVRQVIANGLDLLGVSAPEEM